MLDKSEKSIAQLHGLLCAPDSGVSAFNEEVELFPTASLVNIPKGASLPDIAPNTVFGKRMEQLLKYALRASKRYNILADNIQIIENGTTLGELDFILHDLSENRLIHLELAVKFYLYDPDFPEPQQRWIGPNRRDSLFRKMEKLKNHQFPLLYRPETQNTLRDLNLPDLPMKQALCFKTVLFVPSDEQSLKPDNISSPTVSGTWIRFSEFYRFKDHSFYLPEKPNWIIDPSEHQIWNDYEQTLIHLEALIGRNRAPLCWMKKPNGSVERTFVVWW